MLQYGTDTGWHGLTYNVDLLVLYYTYEDQLWERLTEEAENYGQDLLLFVNDAANRMKSPVVDYDNLAYVVVRMNAEMVAQDEVGEEM